MSYDLYFYKRKDNKLSEEDVATYLTNNLPFNASETSKQWVYENPETGVYFVIEWNEPNKDEEDAQVFDNFSDYINLNFNFSINFFRPRYFGLETFPIIENIIDDLDLFIFNPQETEETTPKEFPKGYLQQQWINHNDKGTLGYFSELNFEFMPLEKSNYMWQYQLNRTELQNNLTEDIFVPGFFILKNKENNTLNTVCVWPEHIPIILPPVDYVIIQKKYKKLFKTIEESGLISHQTIIKELGNYFEEFKHDLPNLKILKQANADKLEKLFNNLKIDKTIEEFGKGIGKDGFVNVKP